MQIVEWISKVNWFVIFKIICKHKDLKALVNPDYICATPSCGCGCQGSCGCGGNCGGTTVTPPAYSNDETGFKKWVEDNKYTNESFVGLWYKDRGEDFQAEYNVTDGTWQKKKLNN